MQTIQTNTCTCSWCDTTQDPYSRCCSNCGHVISEDELKHRPEQHWAASMQPLKVIITFSSLLTGYLLWVVSSGI